MKSAKPIVIILGLLLSFLVDAGSSLAQSEYIAFWPKQYDKPKGKPVTYMDTFKAYPALTNSGFKVVRMVLMK